MQAPEALRRFAFGCEPEQWYEVVQTVHRSAQGVFTALLAAARSAYRDDEVGLERCMRSFQDALQSATIDFFRTTASTSRLPRTEAEAEAERQAWLAHVGPWVNPSLGYLVDQSTQASLARLLDERDYLDRLFQTAEVERHRATLVTRIRQLTLVQSDRVQPSRFKYVVWSIVKAHRRGDRKPLNTGAISVDLLAVWHGTTSGTVQAKASVVHRDLCNVAVATGPCDDLDNYDNRPYVGPPIRPF